MASLFSQPTITDPEDGLVRRLKCRDRAAFDELIERYQGPLYGFVYRQLDDPADAADVVQEVFLKVYRKVDDFRGDCTLKTWMYRIAVHEASNRRRWFSRHRRNEVALDSNGEGGSSWDWLEDKGATPYQEMVRRERLDLVGESLRQIDERLRTAVILRDIQGLSYNEIADALEVSLGTVKSRILRGREALKTRLKRRLAGDALGGVSAHAETMR